MSIQNTLFEANEPSHGRGDPPQEVPWIVAKPLRRMLQQFGRPQTDIRAELVHQERIGRETLYVYDCQTAMGASWAIFTTNSPYGQASVYHRKSRPPIISKDDAIHHGHELVRGWAK